MNKLSQAAAAIQQGKKSQGRQLLTEILRADPGNEKAWLWMSAAVEDNDKKQDCLERVLMLNPDNQSARRSLAALTTMRSEKTGKPLQGPTPAWISETKSQNRVTQTPDPSPQRSEEENALLQYRELMAYELNQGDSRRAVIAQFVERGYSKEAVAKIVNTISVESKPTRWMLLKQLLFSTKGRVTRSTYWLYYIAFSLLYFIAFVIDLAIGSFVQDIGVGLFTAIILLIGLYPGLAVAIKRCHDRGRSGWFLLLGYIPIVNIWVSIELAFLRGTQGANPYGTDPRLGI